MGVDGRGPPRIAYFGTPEFALPALEALAADRTIELALVVTQPDRPAGRGRQLRRPAVAARAAELGLALRQPERASDPDFCRTLTALAPELAVVVAFGEIFREGLLAVPRLGFYNLHASLLPRHRGPSPVAAAIAAGDEATGVTVFRLERRMDAGPVLARRETAILSRETAGELHDRLARLGGGLVHECVRALLAGPVTLEPQPEDQATYCKLLTKADGRLDWTRDARALDRQVRAMTPWPGAHATLVRPGEGGGAEGGGRGETEAWVVLDAEPAAGSGEPGAVLEAGPDAIRVATGSAALSIRRLVPAGRRPMSAAEYLRGHRLPPGSRLEA